MCKEMFTYSYINSVGNRMPSYNTHGIHFDRNNSCLNWLNGYVDLSDITSINRN